MSGCHRGQAASMFCESCSDLSCKGLIEYAKDIEEQKDVLLKVLNSLKNPTYSIQQFLISATEEEGEYEDLGMCEQCGDYIYNYKLICK